MIAILAVKYCTSFMNWTARLSREGGNLLILVHAIWRTLHILTNVHHEVLYIGATSDLFYKNSKAHYQGLSKFIHPKNRGCNCKRKTTYKMESTWKNKLFSGFNPGRKDLFISL